MLNAVLGGSLVLMAWLIDIGSAAATWNATIVGLAILALSLIAIERFAPWEEWINLVLGVWVFVSPWIFGLTGVTSAFWGHLAIGFLVAALAIFELWRAGHRTPHATT
ncbi:MAG TPA: SPW repeat protein [Azospirillum sp.]|nr:SPW repeat protein [Azospirillum sp.]